MLGQRAQAGPPDLERPCHWDLLAFGDRAALDRLRGASDLRRADVLLRVVVDGNRFEAAWGGAGAGGSLLQREWREASERDAYYSEAFFAWGRGHRIARIRRKAVCLWRR